MDEAIENDRLPYFYEGEIEHGPVCSSCSETIIDIGEDGEMELKTESLRFYTGRCNGARCLRKYFFECRKKSRRSFFDPMIWEMFTLAYCNTSTAIRK